MKDTKLRKMIADCLRYIKKHPEYGYYITREEVEVYQGTIDTSYGRVSLGEVINTVAYLDYRNSVFIRGKSYEGYDGDNASQVELYSYRKQTEKEYFDSLCGYILPTEYQQGQYETYLRLKKMFESGV